MHTRTAHRYPAAHRRALLGAAVLAAVLAGCSRRRTTEAAARTSYEAVRMTVSLPSGATNTYTISRTGVTPSPVTLQLGASGLFFEGVVGGRTVEIANDNEVRIVGTPAGGAMPAGLAYLRNSNQSGQFTLAQPTLNGTVYLQVMRGSQSDFDATIPVRAGGTVAAAAP